MRGEMNIPLLFSFIVLLYGYSVTLANIQYLPDQRYKILNKAFDRTKSSEKFTSNTHGTNQNPSKYDSSLFDCSDLSINDSGDSGNYARCIKEERISRTKSNKELNKLFGGVSFRKKKRHYSDSEIPNNYFSFRGAEEHSPDDLDIEGLFESNYGGRQVIVDLHKTTPKDIYIDEIRPIKYEFAIGATSRDKKFDIQGKESNNEIVLIITPKNFFADKDGKLTLLPSLALKINKNSKISTLIKKIHKLIHSAYPDIQIEKIRHLNSQIVLSEAPRTTKLSSLKIKNGNEISVTYKKIPKDETSDNKYYQSFELLEGELPQTPIEAIIDELPEVDIQHNHHPNQNSNTTSLLEDNLLKPDEEESDQKQNTTDTFISGNSIEKNLPKVDYDNENYAQSKPYSPDDEQFDIVHIESPVELPFNNADSSEFKYLFSDEGVDNIYQEKAVEAEKENSNKEIDNSFLKTELNECSYKVHFKQVALPLSNSTTEINQSSIKEISTLNITFYEFEPCRLETLISQINIVIDSMHQDYSLVKLEHIASKRDLLSPSIKDEKRHLLDLEIIKNDEFNAFLKLNSNLEHGNTVNAGEDDSLVVVSTEYFENGLNANKCQVYMTIFVDSMPSHGIEDKNDFLKSLNRDQDLVKSGKKNLKAVYICTQHDISISKVLEKIKSFMKIETNSNGIFICGDRIIDSFSNLSVSVIKSETCVLRFDT